MSCSYKNLLKALKTVKEVVERLLEFSTAFVMLWIGWHVNAWIASFSDILKKKPAAYRIFENVLSEEFFS